MNYYEAARRLYIENGGTDRPSELMSRFSTAGGRFKLIASDGRVLEIYALDQLRKIGEDLSREAEIRQRQEEERQRQNEAARIEFLLGPKADAGVQHLFVRFAGVSDSPSLEIDALEINGESLSTRVSENGKTRWLWTIPSLLDELGSRGWTICTHLSEPPSHQVAGMKAPVAVTVHTMTFRRFQGGSGG